MPDTPPDAARQRVLPIFGTGDLIVMTFLAKQSANVHSWQILLKNSYNAVRSISRK
jgi:hypothetical protein